MTEPDPIALRALINRVSLSLTSTADELDQIAAKVGQLPRADFALLDSLPAALRGDEPFDIESEEPRAATREETRSHIAGLTAQLAAAHERETTAGQMIADMAQELGHARDERDSHHRARNEAVAALDDWERLGNLQHLAEFRRLFGPEVTLAAVAQYVAGRGWRDHDPVDLYDTTPGSAPRPLGDRVAQQWMLRMDRFVGLPHILDRAEALVGQGNGLLDLLALVERAEQAAELGEQTEAADTATMVVMRQEIDRLRALPAAAIAEPGRELLQPGTVTSIDVDLIMTPDEHTTLLNRYGTGARVTDALDHIQRLETRLTELSYQDPQPQAVTELDLRPDIERDNRRITELRRNTTTNPEPNPTQHPPTNPTAQQFERTTGALAPEPEPGGPSQYGQVAPPVVTPPASQPSLNLARLDPEVRAAQDADLRPPAGPPDEGVAGASTAGSQVPPLPDTDEYP